MSLIERLENPVVALPPEELAPLWRRMRIELHCRCPRDFEDGPDLAGRVRGAFGRQLLAMEGATHLRSTQDAAHYASLYDILFTIHGRLHAAIERPKPWVLSAERVGADLRVELTLFGFAGFWAAPAAQALCDALVGGIAIAPESRVRAKVDIGNTRISRVEGVSVTANEPRSVRLIFRTPFLVATQGALTLDPRVLLVGLANRIRGLAHWQDLDLHLDWPGFAAAAGRLELDHTELRYATWHRRSIRHGALSIPMQGIAGTITLRGVLAPFLALLAIGETAYLGKGTAFGLGRYELAIEP